LGRPFGLVGGRRRDFNYQVIIIDPETGPALADSMVAALRDQRGSVRMVKYGWGQISSGDGIFADHPAVGMSWSGRAVVAARDTFNALWANVFDTGSGSWASWSYGGGIIQGIPAVAVTSDGKAYIAARDNWNSYWLVSYTPGGSFGTWQYLAGIFSTVLARLVQGLLGSAPGTSARPPVLADRVASGPTIGVPAMLLSFRLPRFTRGLLGFDKVPAGGKQLPMKDTGDALAPGLR
jgi:hypothetical protein